MDFAAHTPHTELMVHLSSLSTLWFSNFHMPQNYLQGLLEHRLLGPTPRVYDSVGLWWVPRICMYKKSPGDADAPVQGPHFENNCHWVSHTKKQRSRKRGGKAPQPLSSCLRISGQCPPSAKHNQKPEGKRVLPPGSQSSTQRRAPIPSPWLLANQRVLMASHCF